ncbi:MAG TPA: hypothetical protein VFX02_02025 [Gammaproteobacteria bacterium]|nr:hypothetical protein [Gammaproteobacteria bacterium]
MKRRAFLKCTGLCGASVYVPASLTISSLLNEAYAASPDYEAVNYSPPDTDLLNASTGAFPQVINIFLYGGPSELAGNLTNIQELNATSENSYTGSLGGDIIELQRNGGLITRHGFWSGAGGDAMQFLVDQKHMSVYRTMMKRAEDTQSHRQSIFMNQKGTLDIDDSPGIGTRIAKMLEVHAGNMNFPHPVLGSSRTLQDLILPFVSFEGETVLYAPDLDDPLHSLRLKAVTMNENFENPYSRTPATNTNNTALTNLVNAVQTAAVRARYSKVIDSFKLRDLMDGYIGTLQTAFNADLPSAAIMAPEDSAEDIVNGLLRYPNNSFGRQLRAAVTLAIENPDSKFITVSNGGLGGFDDHNNGVDNYPDRMEQLFTALRVAMKHIKYSGRQNGFMLTPGGATTGLSRRTDNIIINVFGDFGRRVNLNNSMGWDHGNCQVFYTLGGSAVRPGGISALGKVVGATRRTGQANTNNQYLEPTSSSYEFEPMSMAASIYGYFGAQNPRVMTKDPDFYPSGCTAINEGVAAEPTLF